jgi:replicative DNA helicase
MSSLGFQFIHSLVRSGNPSPLQDVQREFFVGDELPAYNFVVEHYNRHGRLPDVSTLSERGIPRTLRASEPPSYYSQRLRSRFVYNLINERFPDITAAMRSRNSEEAFSVIQNISSLGAHVLNPATFTTLDTAAAEVLEDYALAKDTVGLRGVTFGYPTLDAATQGAQPGDLVVVAGRPSMGKSYILSEMAFKAWQAGNSLAIVSMEMNNLQVVRRFLGRMIGTNPGLIRSGRLSTWSERALRRRVAEISGMPPVFILSGDMDKSTDAVAKMVAEHLPSVVYVDAAYLLSPASKERFNGKHEKLSQVQKELKQIAIKYDRPIIMTHQLNRNVKTKAKEAADMGDLAGTGSIEQDASIILTARYGPPPFETSTRQIDMLKNRDGIINDFKIRFSFDPLCFDEMHEDDTLELAPEWTL